ncbi:MAG: hypothetical protein V4668_04060 [Patescibacteria group bacterium]
MFLKYLLLLLILVTIIGGGWWLFIKKDVPDRVSVPVNTPDWENIYKPQNEVDQRLFEAETQKTFDDFVTTKAGSVGWQTFNVDNKQVPVTAGLAALQTTIPAEIERSLNSADWGLQSCSSEKEKPKFLLRLLYRMSEQGEFVTYDQKQIQMKNWEPTMLTDVKSVIFPEQFYNNTNFTIESNFSNNVFYTLPGLRQAAVISGSDKIGDFGYLIVDDYVLISNDIKCMHEYAIGLLGWVE